MKFNSQNTKTKNTLLLISIFAVFCAVILIIGVIFDSLIIPWIAHSKDIVMVPNIEGKTLDNAQRILSNDNLQYEITSEQYSEEFEAGIIIKQTPKPKSQVKEGRAIYITVSKGKELVLVPKITGITLRDARVALMKTGLQVGDVAYQMSDSIGVDTVIYQNINYTSKVPFGSTISLVVSKGPQSQVSVPQLFGKDLTEVAIILQENQLVLGKITYQNEGTFMKNTVTSQFPSAAEVVPKNTKIDITVER